MKKETVARLIALVGIIMMSILAYTEYQNKDYPVVILSIGFVVGLSFIVIKPKSFLENV